MATLGTFLLQSITSNCCRALYPSPNHHIWQGHVPGKLNRKLLSSCWRRDYRANSISTGLTYGVSFESRWIVKLLQGLQESNAVTVRDTYSLLRMDRCIGSLGESNAFTSFDANSGYWQVHQRTVKRRNLFATQNYIASNECLLA